MAEAIRVDIGAEFVGKAAFKAAENAAQRLTKQVSTLAKSYIGLQGIRILSRNGLQAAQAFAADDKAARTLTQSLSNLGLAFSDLQVKAFIGDLEKTFGVLDDQLRPAFQRLLTTTGSVTEAQSLLITALNLSAASGADVVTVAGDLSKGYVGQTRSLAKYGLGLSQAQLKAMTFLEVQTKINDLFGGQAQLAADSYSGSIAKLTVATDNAKEAIGKGLFDALSTLGGGGQGGFDNVIKQIDATSNAIASLIRGVAIAAKVLDTALDLRFTSIPKIFAKPAPKATIIPAIAAELKKAAVEKAALKNRQTILKVTKDQTKAIKDQTALSKAGTLFDTEQAGILAALKGDISKEERTRLELQLAILTGNTTEASKLAAELGKAQGLTKELIAYYSGLPDAKNPFSGWITTLLNAQALAASIAAGNYNTAPSSMAAAPVAQAAMTGRQQFEAGLSGGLYGSTPVVNVAVTLDGQEITGAITKVQTNNYLSGKILALERLQSSFG
jgi:hypothetical protein